MTITSLITLLVLLLACLASSVYGVALPDSKTWTNTNFVKQIDLTGSTSHTLTTVNIKPSSLGQAGSAAPYYFLLSKHEADCLAWSRLTVKPALDSALATSSQYRGGQRPVLSLTSLGALDDDASTIVFEAYIPADVVGAEGASLHLETTLNHFTEPLPKTVKQTDPQLFIYRGDSTPRSPYLTSSARIKVKAPSPKILSFAPQDATKSGSIVTFGPFTNLSPFSPSYKVVEGTVHFQSETPRATIVSLDRTAEISHWGDALSIEDRILLRNSGPTLKGHFSRIEHQMASFYNKGSGSALSSVSLSLPPGAKDPWFIDQIGNVSTSRFRPSEPAPELITALSGVPSSAAISSKLSSLELQPRFPLLGGWNYTFSIGYTLPLSLGGWTKSLDSNGEYVTAIPLFTPLKDVAVDSLTTTIVLPEGASAPAIELPFAVDSTDQLITKTYLDTVGRITIVLKKQGVSAEHAQLVYVKYTLGTAAAMIKVASVATVTALLVVAAAVMRRVPTKIR